MKDRWGEPVRVAYAPHEILWIKAAMSLPAHQRVPAYRDIAAMSGRSIFAIQKKACILSSEMMLEQARARYAEKHPDAAFL